MSWNNEIEQIYDGMIAGVMGQALDLPNHWLFPRDVAKSVLKGYIRSIETGQSQNFNFFPQNQTYLTYFEMRFLHLMRAACCFYTERWRIWPWRLCDKNISDLRPLLSINYQGLYLRSGKYLFHGVWDVSPYQRMSEAVLGYFLCALLGIDLPKTESEMSNQIIQNMRDSGWSHVLGSWEEYANYTEHSPEGLGTYDYDDVADLKKGECHINCAYIVSSLRAFNVPSHAGRPKPLHNYNHCFMHFNTINSWLSHGDDVQNRILESLPPEFAMRSEWWMAAHVFDKSEYEWHRACAFDDYFWWCILLGSSEDPWCDVRYLFRYNMLRNRLEHIHEHTNLAEIDDAPSVVPPVFNSSIVDFLMEWVQKKIEG